MTGKQAHSYGNSLSENCFSSSDGDKSLQQIRNKWIEISCEST